MGFKKLATGWSQAGAKLGLIPGYVFGARNVLAQSGGSGVDSCCLSCFCGCHGENWGGKFEGGPRKIVETPWGQ